jgi:hypothetical protein
VYFLPLSVVPLLGVFVTGLISEKGFAMIYPPR